MTSLRLMTALQAARRSSVCGFPSWVDRASWREEVELANGVIIVVARVALAYRRFQITFPDGRTVWESHGLMQPLSVEVERGRYFVAADIHSHLLCAQYDNPEGSVVFFRWEDEEWTRIPRDQYPRNSKVNLLRNPWGRYASEDARGLVRHADKHLRRGNALVHVRLDERIANRIVDRGQSPISFLRT